MRHLALLLVFVPVPAWAVDGMTILDGPQVPIIETVDPDFPRYDLVAMCNQAMPKAGPVGEASRKTCLVRQGRLAGLTSRFWNSIPPEDRKGCVERADRTNVFGYSVLYQCAYAATFRKQNRAKADQIEQKIAQQTGRVPIDRQAVGSIR